MARKLLFGWLVVVVLLVVTEGGLRCAGFPDGTYRGVFARGAGLWESGFTGVVRSGPIPYRVEANAHGFRGPALRVGSNAADVRVVAIGDSMTDGFYVDNEATFPHQLGLVLARRGLDVEVVNAARGAGSIDRFGAILRDLALPLEPDVVLVTFVSNDLGELGRYPLERAGANSSGETELGSVVSYFVTRTAIGEMLMKLLLSFRAPRHTSAPDTSGPVGGDERYQIMGGEKFATNARVFENRFVQFDDRGDGLAISAQLSPVGIQAFELYARLLREFRDACRAAKVQLLFLYMPAYSELYADDSPNGKTPGKDFLMARLGDLQIHTLDLTAALLEGSGSAAGEEPTPLHLAPVDFHLNPAGNGVVAAAVADALIESGMLSSSPEETER